MTSTLPVWPVVSDTDEVYYRYEAITTCSWDEYSELAIARHVHLQLQRLPVIKRTPKGVWVNDYGTKRFVLDRARKRYACPTPEEAVESLLARKRRRAAILRSQLSDTERAIELAEIALNKRKGGARAGTDLLLP